MGNGSSPKNSSGRKSSGNSGMDRRPSSSKKSSSKKGSSKKAAKKQRNKIFLLIGEIAILAVLAVVVFIVFKGTNEETGVEKINVEEAEVISTEISSYFDQTKVQGADGTEKSLSDMYLQVALFGVDSREGELAKNTRTDTIIIASINRETKEVKLCSVYRDTYLNLSNDQYNKCNSAYAKGGPAQAINMLNMNLDLNITNYVTVGFKGVVDTVDALGGVPIEIESGEIGYLNDYQYCIAEDLNRMNQYVKVTDSGLQTLNGLQACGYCRIRYTAGDDFRRTERQRTVLTKMSDQAKTMSAAQLTNICNNSFSNIVTSFDINELISYAVDIPNYNIVGSEGFPFADYRAVATLGSKGSCVVPTDLETNVAMLHKYLFGVDYTPSETVHNCSVKIAEDARPYL